MDRQLNPTLSRNGPNGTKSEADLDFIQGRGTKSLKVQKLRMGSNRL